MMSVKLRSSRDHEGVSLMEVLFSGKKWKPGHARWRVNTVTAVLNLSYDSMKMGTKEMNRKIFLVLLVPASLICAYRGWNDPRKIPIRYLNHAPLE
jgi:hypothetical protein